MKRRVAEIEFLKEDSTSYTLNIPIDAQGLVMDIKMRGVESYEGLLGIRMYECDKTFYENKIRYCRQMGLYAIDLGYLDESCKCIHCEFTKEVEIIEVIAREIEDACGISRNYSHQTYSSYRFTQDYSLKKNALNITWFVTWLCNYKCPFCWERVEEEKYRKGYSLLNEVPAFKWSEAFNKIMPTEIYMTGGEPTIYQHLPDVINHLHPGIDLRMTSNFGDSFKIEDYENFINDGRFKEITVSFHPSEVKTDVFIDKIAYLVKNTKALINCNFGIEMVLYPNDMEYANKILDVCVKYGIRLQFDRYSDPISKYKPSKEEKNNIDILIKESVYHNSNLKRKKITDGCMLISPNEAITNKVIVLCGAGQEGRKYCNEILRNNFAGVMCICDNYAEKGQKCNGIDVISFREATSKFKNGVYIITVLNEGLQANMVSQLISYGISSNQIYISKKREKALKEFLRGKQPIWCPAGMISFHVDPTGNAFPCMLGISNKKMFGRDTMPIYKSMGNIMGDGFIPDLKPNICWESYRCSACDYNILEEGMADVCLTNNDVYFPLPE